MSSIEIRGEGNAELAVLLEYLLMGHGYQVERGPVYRKGMTDTQRAQVLRRVIQEKKNLLNTKEVRLEVKV